MRHSSPAPLVALLLCACAAPPARSFEVESSRELGVLTFDPSVHARDGGYSARLGSRSVWVFGDTILAKPGIDGSRWRSSTVCWTNDFDAHDGLAGLTDPLDAAGAPGEFLPFTSDEAAYNAAHFRQDIPEKERGRWALWPGPIVVDPADERAFIFYAKLKCGSGAWDFQPVGHSIASWYGPTFPVERAEGMLFPIDDVVLGQAAVIDGDWLYAYGCTTVGLTWPTIVARAPMASILERSAWRFWNGREWSEKASDAVAIMDAAPQLSVHWNAHLGCWLAAYCPPLGSQLAVRTAPAPHGPWSERVLVHQCEPAAKDAFIYAAVAHAELQADGGRVEFISYYRPTGPLSGEMRLVELRLR